MLYKRDAERTLCDEDKCIGCTFRQNQVVISTMSVSLDIRLASLFPAEGYQGCQFS